MMENQSLIKQTTELIARDFGLDIGQQPLSEKELFDLLANEVAYMIEHRLDFLMSLMYRLDVEEKKISFALSPMATEAANIALARLIFERQKQRIFTKQVYRQSPIDDIEEGLEF
ncbi:MAG: hypothetical protein AAFP19_07525 [Bacteroidota bacterium]